MNVDLDPKNLTESDELESNVQRLTALLDCVLRAMSKALDKFSVYGVLSLTLCQYADRIIAKLIACACNGTADCN